MKIDAYLWYVRGKGAIATAIQTPQAFVCGDIPPATTTQIIRLTENIQPGQRGHRRELGRAQTQI